MSDDVQKQLDDLLGQVDEKELADIKLGESKQIKKFNLDFLHKNEKDRLEKEDQTQDVFLSDKEEKENKTGEEPKTEIIQKKNNLLKADDKKINLSEGGKTNFNDNLKQRSLKDKVDGLYGENGLRPKDENRNSLSGLNIVFEDKQGALESKIKEMEIERKENETKGAATKKGLSYINLRGLPIVPEALRMISEEEAREKKLICFMNRQRQDIRIAVLDYNEETEEIIERIKKENEKALVGVYLTSRASLDEALKTYAALPKIIKTTDEIKVLEADIDSASEELGHLKDIQTKLKNVSTTGVFSLILAAAVKVEASDIHIESGEKRVEVRFRIDGVLHEVAELNKEQWSKLLSRVKLSAKLKINIKDKPQDGRFSIHIKGKAYDFRVSTLPISYGESVVMRILYQEKIKGMSLENLGLDEYNRQIIEEEIKKPNGLVVITGPTGAGKTTTLYATLNKLNTPDNKIITIEDPIEYKIENINQSEVKKDKDYTFAKALRSIIRQDPDIILVGEIRDRETTDIALNAALTGHLVFTTLHTNDAAGVVPRFLSLGAKPYLLSPALNVVVAQRLVRRICEKCKKQIDVSEIEKERVEQELNNLPNNYRRSKVNIDLDKLVFYKGEGCKECSGLGYKGQVGIFEILKITDEIKDIILAEKVSENRIKEIAKREGMVSLAQDGIIKALRGITALEEVFRVVK